MQRLDQLEKVKLFFLDNHRKMYTLKEAADFFGCSKAELLRVHKLYEEELKEDCCAADYYTALMSDNDDYIYTKSAMLRLALLLHNNDVAETIRIKLIYDAADRKD